MGAPPATRARSAASRAEQPIFVNTMYSQAELEYILQMMTKTGASTIASVMCSALWNYARHLDLDPPIDVFALGRYAHVPRDVPQEPHRAKKTPPK